MNIDLAHRLKQLREQRGLSLNELGQLVGVTKQTIHKYEQEGKRPSTSTVLKLGKALQIHPSELFNSETIDINIDNIRFREEEMVLHKRQHLDSIKSICKDYIHKLIELKALVQENTNFDNPLVGYEIQSKKDVEQAAKLLRKKWKLGRAPITDVIQLVEEKGIVVVEVDFNESFTGLSGCVNNEIHFMVVNKNCKDVTRKRFTSLHELGHITLEFADNLSEGLIEFLCNHFAGAVLLVDDTLAIELGKNRNNISLGELKRVKEKYGASIMAIILRAKHIGFISESTHDEWWDSYNSWNAANSTNEFGNYMSAEKPTLFNNLIRKGIIEKRITWGKAAELKKTKIDMLKQELNELSFKVS